MNVCAARVVGLAVTWMDARQGDVEIYLFSFLCFLLLAVLVLSGARRFTLLAVFGGGDGGFR